MVKWVNWELMYYDYSMHVLFFFNAKIIFFLIFHELWFDTKFENTRIIWHLIFYELQIKMRFGFITFIKSMI